MQRSRSTSALFTRVDPHMVHWTAPIPRRCAARSGTGFLTAPRLPCSMRSLRAVLRSRPGRFQARGGAKQSAATSLRYRDRGKPTWSSRRERVRSPPRSVKLGAQVVDVGRRRTLGYLPRSSSVFSERESQWRRSALERRHLPSLKSRVTSRSRAWRTMGTSSPPSRLSPRLHR